MHVCTTRPFGQQRPFFDVRSHEGRKGNTLGLKVAHWRSRIAYASPRSYTGYYTGLFSEIQVRYPSTLGIPLCLSLVYIGCYGSKLRIGERGNFWRGQSLPPIACYFTTVTVKNIFLLPFVQYFYIRVALDKSWCLLCSS